jgi:DNA processing protein
LRDSMVRGEPVSIDDLVGRTGRPAAELLAELGTLELDGAIGRGPGGTFSRLD